jgi:hypothetical protein
MTHRVWAVAHTPHPRCALQPYISQAGQCCRRAAMGWLCHRWVSALCTPCPRRHHPYGRGPRRRRGRPLDRQGRPRYAEGAAGALGRSWGGLTTKIHLIADQHRRPGVAATTPGQRGGSPMFEPLMKSLRLPRSTGRPRTRPGPGPGRPGLLQPRQPGPPAETQDQSDHRPAPRPARAPTAQGVGGRQAPGLRPGGLPRPQHRGAGDQPAQAEPRGT